MSTESPIMCAGNGLGADYLRRIRRDEWTPMESIPHRLVFRRLFEDTINRGKRRTEYQHTCGACGVAFVSASHNSKRCPPCQHDYHLAVERKGRRARDERRKKACANMAHDGTLEVLSG